MEAAQNVGGVLAVADEIRVRGAGSRDCTDTDIAVEIAHALSEIGLVPDFLTVDVVDHVVFEVFVDPASANARAIDVETDDGQVLLKGNVATLALKMLAERAAYDVPGFGKSSTAYICTRDMSPRARGGRTRIPPEYSLVRTSREFTDETVVPAGLLRADKLAADVWGRLWVLSGRVVFALEASPLDTVSVSAGDYVDIPPDVFHRVELLGDARFVIEFFRDQTLSNPDTELSAEERS